MQTFQALETLDVNTGYVETTCSRLDFGHLRNSKKTKFNQMFTCTNQKMDRIMGETNCSETQKMHNTELFSSIDWAVSGDFPGRCYLFSLSQVNYLLLLRPPD